MAIRTENLTILFVDIAGFTATTNRQSRAENAALLHTFDRTLLPLVKRFKGRVVKSIGDALLLTFRSPTDSMLCAMAMQDAMHECNLHVTESERIRIRIAASLGEVRVTPKDIFGEPVNLASRIESIAPADEIYLSEAVYMAMNKAEVPAQEVGYKELAGMPQAIRIYSIPRFTTHRLIPQNAVPEQGGELLFPYGGMHYRAPNGGLANNNPTLLASPQKIAAVIAAIGATTILVFGAAWALIVWVSPPISKPAPTAAATSMLLSEAPAALQTPTPELKKPATSPSVIVPNASVASKEKVAPPRKRSESIQPESEEKIKSAPPIKVQPIKEKMNVRVLKIAYNSGRISKAEYKSNIHKLKMDYEHKIARLKTQYRGNLISRADYDRAVQTAKREYRGD